MQARHLDAFALSLKAALSAVVTVLAYDFLRIPGTATWAAISAVLVVQPGLHPSLKASLIRVVANLIGAILGAGLFFLLQNPLAAMSLGVLLTGLICYSARLDDALRPAYAAVIIVTFTVSSTGNHVREPLDRIFAVLIGCTCALAVGFLMDKLTARLNILTPKNDQHDTSE
jgi:uncharacterized membrane protein YgaE (UPF0421/DUF939 family)